MRDTPSFRRPGDRDGWRLLGEAGGVLHGVIDRDERVRVRAESYPWASICHLVIRRTDGKLDAGTGWISGRETVLTAGHNIFHPIEGWVDRMKVLPGRNGRAEAYRDIVFREDCHIVPRVAAGRGCGVRFRAGSGGRRG